VRKGELSKLYATRWNVELDLRNIKTTLKMEVLSCLSPQMVRKELWVYLLAYNAIRLLMAQAAHSAGIHPREISFKHTVQMWTEWIAHSFAVAWWTRELSCSDLSLNCGSETGRDDWSRVPESDVPSHISG
jgi:hypothetical protein